MSLSRALEKCHDAMMELEKETKFSLHLFLGFQSKKIRGKGQNCASLLHIKKNASSSEPSFLLSERALNIYDTQYHRIKK